VLTGTQATIRQAPPKEKSKTPNSSRSTSTSSRGEGSFLAGTVLNERYRVTGLLGRGGMGEVYKAEDLKLNQTVALKFLPEHFAEDPAAHERFFGEVRTARQVSHPNVCRVFDIGEVDGAQFLSMEFIDGDDLSSLLRRIGRLPPDKALETARQLCAGLHAVHQAGILHRDFKPANVMIDGRGKARLTDFGIAGLESELKEGAIAGTPAYMSPEQITGKELTTKSDIYSLGLVLYEIFTGKQAFAGNTINELLRQHKTATPTTPSEVVKDIDPVVEQVILRCLEKDPRERPATALQVAMMLPGGNPLEAAIAAGDTPSPEMVAAAPKKGTLKPVVAVALLATVFVCIGLLTLMSKKTSLQRMVPLDKSPEVLRERSRELAANLGYSSVDSHDGIWQDRSYLDYLKDNDKTSTRWHKLASGQPAVVKYWYRLSPEPLVPASGVVVEFDDPPNAISGMAQMNLDMKGRLIFFAGVPRRVDGATGATANFDWASVFKEAGFDIANFENTASQWAPTRAFDERRAWAGKYPDQPDIAIRVEAAAYRGKLVSFEIAGPWSKPAGESTGGPGLNAFTYMLLVVFFGTLIVGAWLAARNVRGGRSNLRGAFRITLFLFALRMIMWAFQTHHVASFGEVWMLVTGLQSGLFWAGFAGLMYLAFEPYLRKHAPERVISWNRLLAGDWRDPLVGRDLLIGVAAALITNVVMSLPWVIAAWLGEPPHVPLGGYPLLGMRGFPVLLLEELSQGLVIGFMVSFVILFFGLLLRGKWRGSAAFWLILFALGIPIMMATQDSPLMVWMGVVFFGAWATFIVLTASRFGVLAMVSGAICYSFFFTYAVTTDITAWYAGDFVLAVVFIAALAIFGFYTSLAGQPLLKGKLLHE
jgi:serine/threonine-protein kinase